MSFDPAVTSAVLVTGIQAAGKSTVGRLLAERFQKGAFIEGDSMARLIVAGRAEMTPTPSPKAIEQLHLRYRNGAMLVDSLVGSGFGAVHADIIVEDGLVRYLEWVTTRPLRIVMLIPDKKTVIERERGRGYNAYRDWIPAGRTLEDAVNEFQQWVDNSPKLGIRVDSSGQTPVETVDEIIERWDEALADFIS